MSIFTRERTAANGTPGAVAQKPTPGNALINSILPQLMGALGITPEEFKQNLQVTMSGLQSMAANFAAIKEQNAEMIANQREILRILKPPVVEVITDPTPEP